jgi:plastocyanin
MRTKRSGSGSRGSRTLGLAVVALLAVGLAPATAAARDSRDIRIEDRCDPVTFAGVPGGCFGDGNVSLQELIDHANPKDFGHRAWRFSREETDLKRGERLAVDNVGGEVHTFTEVYRFGPGGLVPFLDTVFPTNTPAAVPVGAVEPLPQGARVVFSSLSRGTHRFQCMIHAWMQSTVTVR